MLLFLDQPCFAKFLKNKSSNKKCKTNNYSNSQLNFHPRELRVNN